MAAKESEAIILRTWPFEEAHKIVSYFGRTEGRMRGVATNARRSVKRFGAALEMLSHVRVRYSQKPHGGMVRLESCDLIESFCGSQPSYEQIVGGSYVSEVCELMLPEHEANEPFFRLVSLVMREMGRSGSIWRALTYFDLWAVRLAGFLPPLEECIRCHSAIAPEDEAWFRPQWDGLLCRTCSGEESWPLSPASRRLAKRMLATSLDQLPDEGWSKATADDLRRYLGQQIESHLERKLTTRRQLDQLS
jgi:DNA repair protein RecO (recombination protein O)